MNESPSKRKENSAILSNERELNNFFFSHSLTTSEFQVISETKPAPPPPKSNQTVLQLGLPKELQFKIIEQLKASGKSAAQIDLHNLFSEVFSKTMKKMNGLEVSNCSLRFTSNGKRKQNSDTLGTSTAKSGGKGN